MDATRLDLHTAFRIAEVDPRLFGGFLEHMGRAVYEGVYDQTSVHADEHGFRRDVLAALRPLQFTLMRYPGGNFVSGYHWEDGVGPRDQRPLRQERAWNSQEPNHVGTDEFMTLCRAMDWQPMFACNLGTAPPEEAAAWVAYCNAGADAGQGQRRAANGAAAPHDVTLWCLGNEMDGDWQLGHTSVEDYAKRAAQAAQLMRAQDGRLEFVACGSSHPGLPSFLHWDRGVLELAGAEVDYISLHRYVGNWTDDTGEYLATTNSIDRQIEDVDALCRTVQTRERRATRPYLSFDEWNVWYKTFGSSGTNAGGAFPAHLIEEEYNLEDALMVAGFLNSFIRHADCVKIANLAQIVNVIAPILTRGDDLLVQSIYHPIRMMAQRRTGVSLRPAVRGPRYDGGVNGEAAYLDCSAILDGDTLHVFATNRHETEPMPLTIALADRAIAALESGELLTGPDAKAGNSFDEPDVIRAVPFDHVRCEGTASVTLPPLSFAALSFTLGP